MLLRGSASPMAPTSFFLAVSTALRWRTIGTSVVAGMLSTAWFRNRPDTTRNTSHVDLCSGFDCQWFPMTADQYLQSILVRQAVDTSSTSPVRQVQAALYPLLSHWAGNKLRGAPKRLICQGKRKQVRNRHRPLRVSLIRRHGNFERDLHRTARSA